MLTAVKQLYVTLNPDISVGAEVFRRGAAEYVHKVLARTEKPVPRPALTYADLVALGDDDLMLSLKAGCNDALAVLLDRYQRLVFSIVLRIVRDRQEAEDVMQNVFLDVFRAVQLFDPAKGTAKGWLLEYAYHRAINRRRHLTSRKFYQQESIDETELTQPTNCWFVRYTRCELRMLLEQGLSTLRAKQRRVIELVSYEGLSMKEVAEKTGESLVNVRHRYYRGLRKLREFVERSPQPIEFPIRSINSVNKPEQRERETSATNKLAA
jgi:RNA polymerase sigma-70 factor, ECF subfamily